MGIVSLLNLTKKNDIFLLKPNSMQLTFIWLKNNNNLQNLSSLWVKDEKKNEKLIYKTAFCKQFQ